MSGLPRRPFIQIPVNSSLLDIIISHSLCVVMLSLKKVGLAAACWSLLGEPRAASHTCSTADETDLNAVTQAISTVAPHGRPLRARRDRLDAYPTVVLPVPMDSLGPVTGYAGQDDVCLLIRLIKPRC